MDLDQRWGMAKEAMKYNMDVRSEMLNLEYRISEDWKVYAARNLICRKSLSTSEKRKSRGTVSPGTPYPILAL